MSSIRKLAANTLAVGVLTLSGCQLQRNVPAPEALSTMPIRTDPAMQKRQWDPSAAFYGNDTVLAWPNYAPLQPRELPYELNAVMDTGWFLGNLCYIPAGWVLEVPWQMEANKSLSTSSSYTLMPPLINGPEPEPTY